VMSDYRPIRSDAFESRVFGYSVADALEAALIRCETGTIGYRETGCGTWP
jgi:hypothetical protein